MHSPRPHIPDAQADILSQLSRECQVPLHYVIPARTRVKVTLAEDIRGRSNIERAVRKGARRQGGSNPKLEIRGRKKFIEHDGIRERKNVEHPESCTQHRFGVGERVPGKTYARLEIPKCGICEQRIAQMRLRIGELSQNGQLSMHFAWHRRRFVAQPEIDRKVRTPTPIVLHVRPNNRLAKSSPRDRAGKGHTQRERRVGQKIGQ